MFFDALRVRWNYRPKNYSDVNFDDIEPLPQFWLAFEMSAQFPYRDAVFPHERGLWVGVSPEPPDAADGTIG